MKARLTPGEYKAGVLQHDRIVLSKAITLIESEREDDQRLAEELLTSIMPHSGNAIRIGITGVPGVGKSTFIESFGKHLISSGKKIAVITVDPSSQVTKGSILGDKTRMEELSKNPMAFIRPSASGNSIGGVAHKTRETMVLCEAAGFDIIIVETVGVGQSETAVKNMVDFFLLLMLAGAGDELQGIKKGIMEMADGLVITKSDGENTKKASQAKAEYSHALHLFQPDESGWSPRVLTSSAIENKGIAETWDMIQQHEVLLRQHGLFEKRRQAQKITWFHEHFNQLIKQHIHQSDELQRLFSSMEKKVGENSLSPTQASHRLINAIFKN